MRREPTRLVPPCQHAVALRRGVRRLEVEGLRTRAGRVCEPAEARHPGDVRHDGAVVDVGVDAGRPRLDRHHGCARAHQTHRASADRADRFQQGARAVEIDPEAFVEIELCLRRDDSCDVENDIRPPSDERLRAARGGKVGRRKRNLAGKSGRPVRGDDIRQGEPLIITTSLWRMVVSLVPPDICDR